MKNILIPISFSESSKNALIHAHRLATEYGATITLFHCYAREEYNRKYEFGTIDYAKGIKDMLSNFYKENITDSSSTPYKVLVHVGSLSKIISEISYRYDLLILSTKTHIHSQSYSGLSDKAFHTTISAICPVLIISNEHKAFSFTQLTNIWHIERKQAESETIKRRVIRLKINTKLIVSKSLNQKTFTSAFWRNIVNYQENHTAMQLVKISESYKEENIDLLILVNHRKGIFDRFLKDDTFKIINHFDIPILIL